MSSQRRPISRRAAPRSARDDFVGPAAKKTQSPGFAPTWAARPALLLVGEVLGDRTAELAVLTHEHVGEALGPAALGPVLPGVELLARLARPSGHDDGADVLGLEHAEGGIGEVLGALDELVAEAEVGLVRAEATHRVGVGHLLEGRLEVDADELPDLLDDRLAELEHVGLLDEAHLDVELGELGLAVGAEVLVAVAARDLVVALHAGDHEQLLEQLRALRQGVPGARSEPRRDEEVTRTLGSGAGQRRRLDLDEVALPEHLARGGVDPGAQSQRGTGGRCAGAAQVEVAVLEARLLTDGDALVDLEGQGRTRCQHVDGRRDDLDLARGQLGVDVGLGAGDDLTGHLDAELGPQVVGRAREDLVARDDLDHAARVAQVDERHPTVIATLGHPTGERDGLGGVVGAQGAGLMGAEHGGSFETGGG